MPRTNEVRVDAKYSNVLSTSSHETAYSVINGNVVNLLISLRAIEQSFHKEYEQLESNNKDADYESLCEKFYNSYVDMQEALKTLLAETTEVNILHSL